jgi:hypothetical protein
MPVVFQNVTQDVNLVSDRMQFTLNAEKPGTAFGLQGLEQAYAGLLLHEKFGDTGAEDALHATRHALIKAYSKHMSPIDAQKEFAALTAGIEQNLGRFTPARGQALE